MSRITTVLRVREWRQRRARTLRHLLATHSLRRSTMSPLHSIRIASLSAVAVFAALAFGACSDTGTSPTQQAGQLPVAKDLGKLPQDLGNLPRPELPVLGDAGAGSARPISAPAMPVAQDLGKSPHTNSS